MKKSQTVSYTSEELKRRSGQSDWAASAAMTDEEIEAAIASDPEEAARHEGWLKRGRVVRPKSRYLMCVNNKDYEQNLTIHKVYRVIPDGDAEHLKIVRIIDDSGGNHTYPVDRFVPVQFPIEAEQGFDLVTV